MLIYLRHGNDEGKDFPPDVSQHRHDKHLTDRGKKEATSEAVKLIKLYGPPDIIRCSPFARGKDTVHGMLRGFTQQKLPLPIIRYDRALSRFFNRKEQADPSVGPETLEKNVPIYETKEEFHDRVDKHIKRMETYELGKLIWIITHALVYKRVAAHHQIEIPKHIPFLHHFKVDRDGPVILPLPLGPKEAQLDIKPKKKEKDLVDIQAKEAKKQAKDLAREHARELARKKALKKEIKAKEKELKEKEKDRAKEIKQKEREIKRKEKEIRETTRTLLKIRPDLEEDFNGFAFLNNDFDYLTDLKDYKKRDVKPQPKGTKVVRSFDPRVDQFKKTVFQKIVGNQPVRTWNREDWAHLDERLLRERKWERASHDI